GEAKLEIFGYFASLLMGVTLGLMGGGGSILTVPILVYLFQVPPVEATTSSLFIVGTASLIAAVQYGRRQELDFKLALYFSLPSLIRIYLARSILRPYIPDSIELTDDWQLRKGTLILVSFAILMMAASLSMIRKKKPSPYLKNY